MTVPADVLAAYGFEREPIAPLAGGLINETYLVGDPGSPRAVLQKLHPVFEATVNLDIDAVTKRLVERGQSTPTLVRAVNGDPFVGRWRVLTYVPGVSVDRLTAPADAESAGALIGRFHAALDGWDYEFQFERAGVHDTAAHLRALRERRDRSSAEPHPSAWALADAILARAGALEPGQFAELPRRICHGDLKIGNVRFSPEMEAVCLLDLDTMGRMTIAYELGDAMRSWCNRSPEDAAPAFDADLFAAAMRGYRTTMPKSVTAAELAAVAAGTGAVCLELAARFCTDTFDDRYFGWDSANYPSRRHHNQARAASMLALAEVVLDHQTDLEAVLAAPPTAPTSDQIQV